jgi:ADP-heptose:LPS heptosyltransferase
MAMISRADVVVSNSSFAMHAAAATGVHAIVLLGEEYESARAHAAQWGHDELTTVLGRDDDRPNIFEPAEVLDIVSSRRELAGSRHGSERSSASEVGR